MTTQEALDKVRSICLSHTQELSKEIEQLKGTPAKDLTVSLEHEVQQISKSLRILYEFISNSVDDGK
jgi:flagellin-specific chaperone FliS